MFEVKSTELLEYAKYILNPMVTNYFHVTINQGLITRFLRPLNQDALYFKIQKNFCQNYSLVSISLMVSIF